MRKLTTLAAAALLAGAPLLAGCTAEQGAEQPPAAGSQPATEVVTVHDAWTKAAEGMTGVFGTLENTTDRDLVITEVESEAAGMVELHEVTADGVMQKIQGDVVVPAKGTLELVPGGNHIMLMKMPKALVAGDEVAVTVRFDDGSSAVFTALVKDYSGANEDYDGGHDMDHGSEHGSDSDEHAAH